MPLVLLVAIMAAQMQSLVTQLNHQCINALRVLKSADITVTMCRMFCSF